MALPRAELPLLFVPESHAVLEVMPEYIHARSGFGRQYDDGIPFVLFYAGSVAGEIALVVDDGHRNFSAEALIAFRPQVVRVIDSSMVGVIHHQQYTVRGRHFVPGPADTLLFNFVLTVAQSSGIDNMQRHAIDLDMLPKHVTGRAGNGGDDGTVGAAQGIEQAGFAGVGLAGNHQLHPLLYQATLPRLVQYGFKLGNNPGQLFSYLTLLDKVDLLLREIDGCLYIHPEVNDHVDQFVYFSGKFALQ